ncbi:MAG TPA: hypothetical protein VNR65_10445, partial [Geobacterales bacterium]|nr:hypothetical protein [Geobacterales bacterium]
MLPRTAMGKWIASEDLRGYPGNTRSSEDCWMAGASPAMTRKQIRHERSLTPPRNPASARHPL